MTWLIFSTDLLYCWFKNTNFSSEFILVTLPFICLKGLIFSSENYHCSCTKMSNLACVSDIKLQEPKSKFFTLFSTEDRRISITVLQTHIREYHLGFVGEKKKSQSWSKLLGMCKAWSVLLLHRKDSDVPALTSEVNSVDMRYNPFPFVEFLF